jgi:hypothetical protein
MNIEVKQTRKSQLITKECSYLIMNGNWRWLIWKRQLYPRNSISRHSPCKHASNYELRVTWTRHVGRITLVESCKHAVNNYGQCCEEPNFFIIIRKYQLNLKTCFLQTSSSDFREPGGESQHPLVNTRLSSPPPSHTHTHTHTQSGIGQCVSYCFFMLLL